MTLKKWILTGLVSLGFLTSAFPQEKPGYFMHPDVFENTIVFVAEGDLWKGSLSGGDRKSVV